MAASSPRRLSLVATALAALSIGAPVPSIAAGDPVQVSVPTATSSFLGTGLTPRAGRLVVVKATGSGTYCGGCIAPTPKGDTSQTGICGGGYDGLGGVACIALVGRWGSGPAFVIGAGKTLTAPGGAELQLGVHDWKFDDNTGTYAVTLRITQPVTIKGRVLSPKGEPCEGLLVGAYRKGRLVAKTTSTTLGRYTLEVPQGVYGVRANDESGPATTPVRVEADDDVTGVLLETFSRGRC